MIEGVADAVVVLVEVKQRETTNKSFGGPTRGGGSTEG